MRKLLLLILFLPTLLPAQKKKLTLDEIYRKDLFTNESIGGFDYGERDILFNPGDVKDESGKKIETGDHLLTSNRKTVLFFSDKEQIYRRSSRMSVHIYDIASRKSYALRNGKVMYPTLSPDNSKIAYVFDNNLYIHDLVSRKTIPVTQDGRPNSVICGASDWVYEEEFKLTRGFEWSPSGNYLAYYRFDESRVKEYQFTLYDSAYNSNFVYKYPKAGEENSRIEIHLYNLANGKDVRAQYDGTDIYIPRIKWMPDNKLAIFWMNRLQNELKILATDPDRGVTKQVYIEKNKYYIDISDNWWFFKDGTFMFTSEMNGYNHLYLQSFDKRKRPQVKQLTSMKHDIDVVNGVDESKRLVYFTMAYPTPMDRNLFVCDFEGRNLSMLTGGRGWHQVEMNREMTEFYDYYSNINTPQTVYHYTINRDNSSVTATQLKTLSENKKLRETLDRYELSMASFIRIPNARGDTLNGWMLKPPDFDNQVKYPVLFCNYGGPGSQQVANRYGAVNMWHQLLAQNGFIVVSIDNTGTGFRGQEFKKKTYLQVGKLEIDDQIAAARYMGNMPYIDKNRIGHFGWSFGGFMSALAITKGADVFKAAVAVAPVTSWRFYDNIYIERFMRTPAENPRGYDENSPINHAHRIKGKLLLVHGTADDNVHFQNNTEFVRELVRANVDFENVIYPNKNHRIAGTSDNTTYHLRSKITRWLIENLKENRTPINESKNQL